MNTLLRWTGCVIASLAMLCSVAPAQAVVSYSGSATVTTPTSQPSLVAVGDVFHFTFSYDPSATDTDAGSTIAVFATGLTQFTVWADAGNTGTWDPSGGIITPNALTILNEFGGYDAFQFGVNASGLPEFTPADMVDDIRLVLRSSDTGLLGPDTGSGQTIPDILGGPLPTNPALYDLQADLRFNEIDGPGFTAQITALTLVPEPASLAMVLLGVGGLTMRRRCAA